jgi:hypothetical protein
VDSLRFLTLFDIKKGDPLSPPEGEAAQGEHPLDPLFSKGIGNILWGITISGNELVAEGRAAVQEKFIPVWINRPAQRGPDEAAERPRRGGLARNYQN